ncbi:hypothetical protein KUCAC02_001638, partial [Chaenocephalus aceratus]
NIANGRRLYFFISPLHLATGWGGSQPRPKALRSRCQPRKKCVPQVKPVFGWPRAGAAAVSLELLEEHTGMPCLSATPIISTGSLHPTSPLQPSVLGPSLPCRQFDWNSECRPGSLPGAFLKQLNIHSSLRYHTTPLRPRAESFNREQ